MGHWECIFTLLHSESPKLYTVLAFLSAIGLNRCSRKLILDIHVMSELIQKLKKYCKIKSFHACGFKWYKIPSR